MTSASREMDSGAALRASAISASRSSIRYWSTGAMFGYGVLVSCGCAFHAAPSTTTNAKLRTTNVVGPFRLIDFSQDLDFVIQNLVRSILGLFDNRLIVNARGRTDSTDSPFRRSSLHAPGQDFEILTTTRAWVAVPWDFNSCIGLRFRADGSGDMVFARLQIVRAEIKFRFSLQIPNELALIYHDAIVWKPFELKEGGKSKVVQYSLKEAETTGVTANIGPFKFYWTLSLEKSPFPDEVKLGVVEQPLQFYGHNVNEATRLADAED
jgi:hypothetical protein